MVVLNAQSVPVWILVRLGQILLRHGQIPLQLARRSGKELFNMV